jgi:4,5-dihydroxyphthalate decarboxylase
MRLHTRRVQWYNLDAREEVGTVTRLQLTMGCGPYDRTEALRAGIVPIEGADLTYVPIQSPPELFARAVKKASFDVAEMSLSLYVQLRSAGRLPFVALPIFPSRMFRHGYVFVRTDRGIAEPHDLEGRRIGVQEFHQTAGVWIRGILAEDHGVDLDRIQWREGGVNAPRRPDELDLRPTGALDIEFIGSDVSVDALLRQGELDGYLGARKPHAHDAPDVPVDRLFPEPRSIEREYYARTGIFPIMHTLVVRESLLERHPWIAESVYKAFEQSKRWCLEQMHFTGTSRYTLPWLHADLEEVDELFGGDPWPYGLERNRVVLEAFVRHLVAQRFLDAPLQVDDLFVPVHLSNE